MDNHADAIATADRLSKFVATEVRAELAAQKRTQSELAQCLGLTEQTVGRRLNGLSPFSAIELPMTAHWLGLSVSELFRRAEVRASGLKQVA